MIRKAFLLLSLAVLIPLNFPSHGLAVILRGGASNIDPNCTTSMNFAQVCNSAYVVLL